MTLADLKVEVDEEGYLINPDDWNRKVACALAEQAGIEELTEDRLELIQFLRDYYKKYNFFPILGSICKKVHQPRECVVDKFMDPLTAWKVAGLTRPNDQLRQYLEGGAGIV